MFLGGLSHVVPPVNVSRKVSIRNDMGPILATCVSPTSSSLRGLVITQNAAGGWVGRHIKRVLVRKAKRIAWNRGL